MPLKEACKQLNISYKTLYSWVKNNNVSYTKIGNRYYMTQEQLNALVLALKSSKSISYVSRANK